MVADLKLPSRVIVSRDGAQAVCITELRRSFNLAKTSAREDAHCFEYVVKLDSQGEKSVVQVAASEWSRERYEPARYNLSEGGEQGLMELSLARLGLVLEEKGLDWFRMEGDKIPRAGLQMEDLRSREPFNLQDLATYVLAKAYWAFEYGHRSFDVTEADKARTKNDEDAFRRAGQIYPEYVQDESTMGRVRYAPSSRLLQELPAGRVPGTVITPVFQVERYLTEPRYAGPREHIRKGNQFLRAGSYDPANAVKEAGSSLESMAKVVCGSGAKVSGLIQELQRNHGGHPALLQTMEKLWGFTSNVQGARHAGGGPPQVSDEEAHYALNVAASALLYIRATVD